VERRYAELASDHQVRSGRRGHLHFRRGDGDTLIDAAGSVFELPYDTGTKKTQIKDASRKMDLAVFSEVVQAHLKAVGQTAVAPKTFAEGLELIEKSLG